MVQNKSPSLLLILTFEKQNLDKDKIFPANFFRLIFISFDSLFYSQINDSVYLDDRQMKSSLYNIYRKNPVFGQILDTLKTVSITAPIYTDDGWYIIKIDNIWKNLITSETEQNKRFSDDKRQHLFTCNPPQ